MAKPRIRVFRPDGDASSPALGLSGQIRPPAPVLVMAVHPPCPWFTHGRRYRLDNLPGDARAWLAPTWVAQPSAGERSVGHTAGSTWIVISMLATLVGSHAVFSFVVVRDDLLTMRDSSSSSTSCDAWFRSCSRCLRRLSGVLGVSWHVRGGVVAVKRQT